MSAQPDLDVAPARRRDPEALLDRLVALPSRADRLTHRQRVAARPAALTDWPAWADPAVVTAYAARGVGRPWQHQVAAAEAAHRGEHVVLATGTASGKSLAYLLPALSDIRAARGPRGQRGASVLYLAPTKALAHDQWTAIRDLGLDVRVATHDGDSTAEEREWTRDHAEYVLSNPDMLHRSLLPGHERWISFFRSLRYVVIDECHHYRGVFGAHVAQVVRRLRRICELHGASPVFVLASATVADPDVTARRMTGLDVTAVTEDGSPRGALALGLWEPPLTSYQGENGAPVRRPATAETADLLADLVVEDVRTLAFVRSRHGVETVARRAAELVEEVDPSLAGRVDSYRGGYLPEERRALEQDLRSGRLLGMAATNALELGIDISGLDAVVVTGYPGTRAAFWQQVGRAGRDGGGALGLFVARDDPLDTYLVHHPEALLGRPVEGTVFDTDNPYILGPHLCAAAQESPVTVADAALFGPRMREVLGSLVERGLLRRRAAGWYWTDRARAADLADIRSTGGAQVQLVEAVTGRVVGTVDGARAHSTAHEGAVYLHRGETWLVESLDLEEHVATLRRADVDHTTTARDVTDIEIVAEREHADWGPCRVSFGTVEVTSRVTSYLRRRTRTGEVIDEKPLDLPARTLSTAAVWWTVPDDVVRDLLTGAGLVPADLPGAAHAAEHCSIGLLPLFATCDRWDIGGVSTARHPDTGVLTVFVHDGHPGGAGFAERGYRTAAAWLRATRATIAACECATGCPSCIQSPKCGNGNDPLDKAGAVALLDVLLREAPDADTR
ncbi:DEAD/DEAH box helicase [Nocardioides sp. SLBN-35]|uniref:DEAD/DEAH box helicase n=1 Tax=Nocardioides sp. SLBN-35 TaxID=2768445 RepID=UPI00116D0FA4|nr:DEAD/DEAH box helicase [Nocardioides sp. SLBN-35]TQK68290.1 DEAD/DEAH box helicase domain-containing protein [Nocardioides sp. SLBN-35]